MNWTGLRYQIRVVRHDKLCILTFLLPIFVGMALRLMGELNLSSAAEPVFGVIQDDLPGAALDWLEANGSVEMYGNRKNVEKAVLDPATQIIGVVSDGGGIETFRSGDELQMFAVIADVLPDLFEQRESVDQAVCNILPANRDKDVMKSLLIVITIVTAMFMGCTFNAMNILSEKEDGIMFINKILPVSRSQYVGQKIAVGFLGGFFSTVITAFVCIGISAAQIIPLLLLAALSAFIAALTGLFIAYFAKGLMEGIVYIKIIMIAFLAPPVLFYLLVPARSIFHGFTYIFPSSATFYGMISLLEGRVNIVKDLIVLVIHGMAWFLLYIRISVKE